MCLKVSKKMLSRQSAIVLYYINEQAEIKNLDINKPEQLNTKFYLRFRGVQPLQKFISHM